MQRAGRGGAGEGLSAPARVSVLPSSEPSTKYGAKDTSDATGLGKWDFSCDPMAEPCPAQRCRSPKNNGTAPAIVQVLKNPLSKKEPEMQQLFGEGSFTWLIHHKLYYCFRPYCRFTTRCFRDLAFSTWYIPSTAFKADRQVVVKSAITVKAGKFCLNMIKNSVISTLWLMIVYYKCTLISIIYSQNFIAAFMIWQANLWKHI